jgi:deoxyribonuclease-2
MVENVDEIDFGKWIHGFNFSTHRDHSKWAISFQSGLSENSMSKVVCIGDINRMTTQKKRAGGTVCFENEYVWKAYSGLVKNIESCPLTG